MITPEDADGMFDLLTYQKGGSVLRMLERWLGADAFRAGVRALSRSLPAREHRDHRPVGLAGVGDRPAGAPHHGLVDLPARASRSCRPQRDGDQVTITQERFTYDGVGAERAAVGDPGARARARRRRSPRRARCCSTATPITFDAPADALVVLDAGGEGFYRVVVPGRVARPPARRGRARAARTVLARRRPVGRGARRPRDAPPSSSRSRASFAARTTSSCGACS